MVENLNILRDRIDNFDKSITDLLAQRMRVVRRVGEYKKKHNLPICDKERQKEVLKTRVKQGKTAGLNEKFVKNLYNLIFNEALNIQRRKK